MSDFRPKRRLFQLARRALGAQRKHLPRPLKRWARYVDAFGALEGTRLLRELYAPRRPGEVVPLRVPGLSRPLWLRPGTTDVDTFEEAFILREYEVDLGRDPEVIIDGGANCGTTSVWFAERYPGATIVAVEPDSDNFAILGRNAQEHPGIRPVQKGLWNRSCRLAIANPTAAAWSFEVIEDEAGPIDATTIDDLLSEIGKPRADVVKLDIEGSEREVLDGTGSWMAGADFLFVELHDRKRPGCSEALRHAAGDAFEWGSRGEKVVLTRRH